MTPFWQDDHLTLYGGDCRAVLAEMPAESVHCVVTSPPYWGLRDYGTATWDGGDPECDHETPRSRGDDIRPGDKQGTSAGSRPNAQRTCARCGACRVDSQLGLEPTPEEYVANMVAVFREVRRVLRADGTLWLNLGDSYAADRGGSHQPAETMAGGRHGKTVAGEKVNRGRTDGYSPTRNAPAIGLKHKDLVGIPWRVAFALQADGWYLRSDIIWSKPNPMPESVTDRPTKAHEYLFLLSKSPRYYFDSDAVRETLADANAQRTTERYDTSERGPRDGGNGGLDRLAARMRDGSHAGRNLRSVWTIATEPYPGAHFATFPRKLVEPCVKAGTSERGVCPECGAPWVRVVAVGDLVAEPEARIGAWDRGKTENTGGARAEALRAGGFVPNHHIERTTTGWRASCAHDADPVPAQVLDPFAGSGTTLLVAQSLGRRGVGIDLNPEYLRQALERNRQTPLGLVG